MIRLLFAASIAIHDFLRRWMPTNVIRDLIRTRQGLKWGVPAMLLAAPYFAAAYWLTTLLANGAPGWLNLLVLLCVWSGFKMLWLGAHQHRSAFCGPAPASSPPDAGHGDRRIALSVIV